MNRSLLAGLGVAPPADLVLDLGSTHPSSHGALQLALELDGDVVVRADPHVGLLHRGVEKLFEVRDYRQVLALADRHDWTSAFANELGIALAVERLMGLQAPERAVWLRTLLAELTRVASGLAFLSASLPGLAGAAERDALQGLLEEATGGRLHLMANRVGGLAADVPAGWPDRAARVLDRLDAALPGLAALLEESLGATRGLGVLPASAALAYGCSGAVARASGVDVDVRRDDPYLAYAELAVPVVLGEAGDVLDRFRGLLAGVRGALGLARDCLQRLPGGPVDVRLPKSVRPPEGSTYAWTEGPLGASGYWLVSRGGTTPWRLAMRTPSFNHVSALPALLPGVRLPDLPVVLASLFFVLGDVDK